MPSPLFPGASNPQQQMPSNGIIEQYQAFKQMAGGNPGGMMQAMMQSNPQFAAFVQSVKGLTPQQAFQKFGLDYNQFRGII